MPTDEWEALAEAADCLAEAVAARITDGEDIPAPTRLRRGMLRFPLSPVLAYKAALYSVMRRDGISKSELARRLGVDEKDVRRLVDPRYRGSKVERLRCGAGRLRRGSADHACRHKPRALARLCHRNRSEIRRPTAADLNPASGVVEPPPSQGRSACLYSWMTGATFVSVGEASPWIAPSSTSSVRTATRSTAFRQAIRRVGRNAAAATAPCSRASHSRSPRRRSIATGRATACRCWWISGRPGAARARPWRQLSRRRPRDLEPAFRLLKLDTDAAPAIAARYAIRSIPTLMLFRGGEPVARTAGAT